MDLNVLISFTLSSGYRHVRKGLGKVGPSSGGLPRARGRSRCQEAAAEVDESPATNSLQTSRTQSADQTTTTAANVRFRIATFDSLVFD